MIGSTYCAVVPASAADETVTGCDASAFMAAAVPGHGVPAASMALEMSAFWQRRAIAALARPACANAVASKRASQPSSFQVVAKLTPIAAPWAPALLEPMQVPLDAVRPAA